MYTVSGKLPEPLELSSGRMNTIGLLAAMSLESEALLRCIKKWERITIGSFRAGRFWLLDRECLFVTTGMGHKRATEGTKALLAETHPDLLVSFGIAGAVFDDLDIGDVVIAGKSYSLVEDRLGQAQPLATLSSATWNAVTQILQAEGVRMVAGTAITTRGSQVVPQSLKKVPHPILEMETSGIAQVAADAGIPLLSIRSISDGPKAPIPVDLEAVIDDEYNFRIAKLLFELIRKPRIILQSREMLNNSRKAADRAARALFTILSQPSPVISGYS